MNPMNKIRTKQVCGKQVQIYLLPATEGLRMAKELADVFVPTAGAFYQGVAEGGINFENLAMVLVSELDKVDVAVIIARLLKDVAVDGSAINFDDYFMANYGELIEMVSFAMSENFSSFFAAKGLFERFLPKVEDQTPAE